jgi:hypothetical protein
MDPTSRDSIDVQLNYDISSTRDKQMNSRFSEPKSTEASVEVEQNGVTSSISKLISLPDLKKSIRPTAGLMASCLFSLVSSESDVFSTLLDTFASDRTWWVELFRTRYHSSTLRRSVLVFSEYWRSFADFIASPHCHHFRYISQFFQPYDAQHL